MSLEETETHGRYLARIGSPSAAVFARAEELYAAYDREVKAADPPTRDTGAAEWTAARQADDEARDLPGYLGLDFDPEIADDARHMVALVRPDLACTSRLPPRKDGICECPGCVAIVTVRENLVDAGVSAGANDARARRSVIDGMLRAMNPAGGIRGGLYRPKPAIKPEPPSPKRCA